MAEERLYAFGKSDANFLKSIIPGSGTTGTQSRRPVGMYLLICKTGGSGIAADSSATVYYREPTTSAWTDSTEEYTAYNIHPTATVAADTIIIIAPINGRWVVIWEACP